jgi:hypothetical protein
LSFRTSHSNANTTISHSNAIHAGAASIHIHTTKNTIGTPDFRQQSRYSGFGGYDFNKDKVPRNLLGADARKEIISATSDSNEDQRGWVQKFVEGCKILIIFINHNIINVSGKNSKVIICLIKSVN